MLRRKIDRLLPAVMREQEIGCWLIFTRENSRDPIAEDVGGGSVVARAAFVFYLDETDKLHRIAITAGFDADEPRKSGIYNKVVSYQQEGVAPHLKKLLDEVNPKKIAIDYSRDEPLADGLTTGMRSYLIEALGESLAARFVSAENLIVSFRTRKLPEEIDSYQRAVAITQQIAASALTSKVVTAGKTTAADLESFMQGRAQSLGAVLAFVSITLGSSSSSRAIQRGDIVRVDFGVQWNGYKTDIQRTAYVLRDTEDEPPARIKKMWETALRANRAALLAMTPGSTGVAVDAAARRAVALAGYKDYDHATGHSIGFEVHDAGPILGPDWKERYGSKVLRKIEIGQLFAVEPSVTDPEMTVAAEEEVVIEKEGARYLGMPQVALILIR